MDIARVQRRTVTVLFGTQMVGGVGVAIGMSVGALLAADMAGTTISGLASSASVVGAALIAVPVTRLIRAAGRRPGLALAYVCGTAGAVVVVAGAAAGSVPLLLFGILLFGGGSAANLQARYAAVDLAEPGRRGRQLSLVVWATTIGAVAGPNLAPLADRVVRPLGLREYSGPFAFSALAFVATAAIIGLLLRPDPLLTARAVGGPVFVHRPAAPAVDDPATPAVDGSVAPAVDGSAAPAANGSATPAVDGSATPAGHGPAAGERSLGLVAAARLVSANQQARLGISAVAVGHLVMVGVMAMTPVHIGGYVHRHADVLRIVGVVLSLHIAGMYALSPVVGWLTDRYGRHAVILGGAGTLLTACAVAGTAGDDTPRLSLGLALIGLGWSATMVAGSTLLSESVGVAARPSVQGLSDVVMGLAGATAGALSGVVVSWAGYPTLALLAALATVPLAALALRAAPAARHAAQRPGRTGPGRMEEDDAVRRTDFWRRLEQVFGPAYAASVAHDQVLPQLGGRTIDRALAEGEEVVTVWRAVVAAYPDRVPAKLR